LSLLAFYKEKANSEKNRKIQKKFFPSLSENVMPWSETKLSKSFLVTWLRQTVTSLVLQDKKLFQKKCHSFSSVFWRSFVALSPAYFWPTGHCKTLKLVYGP